MILKTKTGSSRKWVGGLVDPREHAVLSKAMNSLGLEFGSLEYI
jgi:hypothetical protein